MLQQHHPCDEVVFEQICGMPSFVVQHPVMIVLKLNAVSAIYSPFIEYSKNQIDFLICGLRFKHGFGTMDGKRELFIEFLYVGVEKFICAIYGRDSCQA